MSKIDLNLTKQSDASDISFEKIMSNRHVLARVLVDYASEFSGRDPNDVACNCIGEFRHSSGPSTPLVPGLNAESLGTGSVYGRSIPVWPDENTRILIDIKGESNFDPGYSLADRLDFNVGRGVREQKGVVFSDDNCRIDRTISLLVLLSPPEAKQNKVGIWQSVGLRDASAFSDLGEFLKPRIMMIGIGDPEDAPKGSALRMLDIILSSVIPLEEKMRLLRDEFNMPISEEFEKEVSELSDLAQGFFDEGKEYMATGLVLSFASDLREDNPQMDSEALLDKICKAFSKMPDITRALVQEILSENGVIA